MRKTALWSCIFLIIIIVSSSALAVDSLTFSQTCRNKLNTSVTLKMKVDGSDEMVDGVTLNRGTYVKVIGSEGDMSYIVCSPYNSDDNLRYGYVPASSVSSAVSSVTLQSGKKVSVPEALLKSKSALDYYLDMEYGETSGNSNTYVDEEGKEQDIGEEPEENYDESSGLTREEWEARMAKAQKKNGSTTGTVWTDAEGQSHAATIITLGLGISEIRANGEVMRVPTSTLSWDTEAPDDKVLGIVNANKQGYATLRSKASKKAFVMDRCITDSVVRIISYGKNWCMVDYQGMRGYLLTDTLNFYSNEPREFKNGCISFRGKTSGSKNTIHTRAAAKSSSRQLGEYPVGTPVAVFSSDEKWSEIDIDGYHCYVMSEFVTLTDE